MDVLLVNGFASGEPTPALHQVETWLNEAGHAVSVFDLAHHGFDAFMTQTEREAYHSDTPLVTPGSRAAADAVLAAEAIVICYPIIHQTAPARVKSWQERVFVLGLAFRFAPSGRITGALDHLDQALVLGVDERPDGRWWRGRAGRRNSFGPCLARSFFLSSNRTCRSRYLTIGPAGEGRGRDALTRW